MLRKVHQARLSLARSRKEVLGSNCSNQKGNKPRIHSGKGKSTKQLGPLVQVQENHRDELDHFQSQPEPEKQQATSWDKLCFLRCSCVSVCAFFSTFPAFSCWFEFSWQSLQVFSGTDAWQRRMLGVLKQSNAWPGEAAALL